MDNPTIIIIVVFILYICFICSSSLSGGGGALYYNSGTSSTTPSTVPLSKQPTIPVTKVPSPTIKSPQPSPSSQPMSSQPAPVNAPPESVPTEETTIPSTPPPTSSPPPSSSGANTIPANCPSGYTNTDGPAGLFCYQNCPTGWLGNDSPHFCQHNTIYSTVGSDTTKSIPNGCDTGLTLSSGLCYKLPDSTWAVTTPGFIGKICPTSVDGQTISDSGTTCWYDRGVGTIPTSTCPSGQVVRATDCYQAPPSGYDWTTPGGLLIGKVCPSGTNDSGTTCWYDRGIGTAPTYTCPIGQVVRATDCYQNPPSGNDWTTPGGLLYGKICPSGTNDSGTTCWYDRGVGTIPTKQPCSTWNSTWRDDGTSCWEDLSCKTVDNGYYNYSWGCVGCYDGNNTCRNDCYRTWIANLQTSCTGCGCIKKTLGDRQTCSTTQELVGGLCYTKPQTGYTCAATICSMPKNVTAGTRAGASTQSCPSGKVIDTGLCYTPPQSGFTCGVTNCSFSKDVKTGTRVGASTASCPTGKVLDTGMCYTAPKTGFTCAVTNCSYSKQVQSQIGTLPTGCPDNRVLVGRLCYPACPSGYERRGDNLEYCSTICPSGFTNIGIGGCQKPTQELIKVGTCPTGYTKSAATCTK